MTIGRLQEEMEAARVRALDALRVALETIARIEPNPAAFSELEEVRADRQAEAEFQSALQALVKASLKFGSGEHRQKP